ncbi:DUF2750 domain-containing protein (plasmid) [Chryseobacterium panacisoli]|uniref:DUF2750 domain-containing protein n=1 Tax=Chryseobacterium panacisoli TaxID=1807141 RepID=A0A5D9A0F8_9FLAO|nr:DUF2750 domain-containing protein [Chryseobacterium panacisoli]TZG00041.1 DUF2750 domain-containing protein [Chryseobacterium panacisoli]
MHSKEIENILRLEPIKRYEYFIKKAADFEQLWTIIDQDGDYVISEIDEFNLISFWPAEEFVTLYLERGWDDCKPIKLTLDDLKENIFDIINSENYLINVFPVNGKSGFVVNLEEFNRDLQEELDKIE